MYSIVYLILVLVIYFIAYLLYFMNSSMPCLNIWAHEHVKTPTKRGNKKVK